MRLRLSTSLATALALAAGACTSHDAPVPRAPIPPVATGKVRVRVFTEPSPVRILASAGSFVFVGTEHDLERWDDKGGMITLSSEYGLAGRQIVALAPDSERRLVWVLTDAGLGHYDADAEVYREQIAPPSTMGIDFAAIAKDGASMASAADGGVWIGTAEGLLYVSSQGGWSSTGIKEPIQALARDRGGWLWVSTQSGLVARKPTGETLRLGGSVGFTIADPRILVELPGERMLVFGTDEAGHERLAIGKQTQWTTYRALPDVKWSAAARRGNGTVVMGGDRVYRLVPASSAQLRPLTRDGVRLVPVAGGSVDWVIDPLDVVTPPGATSIGATGAAGAADGQLLIGTRDLGTARYREGDTRPSAWLRRREMFRDAQTLSVACARAQDCWIATGARSAWRWNGDRFSAAGPDQIVLAVVRDPDGPIYALHRSPHEKVIKLSRIEDRTWTAVPKVAITTPGDAPEIGFARFSAPGSLWLGLRYRDGEERRSYGIAIVDTETGKLAYHRAEAEPASPVDKTAKRKHAPPKMLPIPLSVVDGDVRGETAWFATTEGVARLARSGEVKLWTEADDLRSEIARAVTIASNGHVIVATGAGAGRWDGKAWDFPAALRFEINDVAATRNGQVWMATERGIAAWDGEKVRRVDVRRGLAENEILDIAVDQFDRVWARGPGSLTLISQ